MTPQEATARLTAEPDPARAIASLIRDTEVAALWELVTVQLEYVDRLLDMIEQRDPSAALQLRCKLIRWASNPEPESQREGVRVRDLFPMS